ncbi:phosphatase PAP2 family protein [Acutalibacter sp. 1XD8-33]|uniref:phosphatase PAP2 family protein n=1 Tax=Acutalibacter sp. 1XD8-33 TaxID=2320081 RepID=UPI000EA40816|nr:phosphatase PAP2 family protein [Acutalibacter sp. 1XD8-33]RKJ39476.1 phosphatase PAP2 family protein [Acutalibacter sp. 1XD8-33]
MEGVNPFDGAVMSWVQETCHNPFFDWLFPTITYLGEGGAFWIALGVLLVIFGRKGGWRVSGILLLCAMLLGLLMGELALKNLVCRPRPFQDFPGYTQLLIPPPSGFSFPSGHSCSSFAAATVVFARDKRWGAGAYILATLIAFSRVFLFVHYPTDVLCGAALGMLCGLAAERGFAFLCREKA